MSSVGFGMAIGVEQVSQAKEVGFKSIINICLDYQAESDMSKEAALLGVGYISLPIEELNVNIAHEFSNYFNFVEKPVLILGKTGEQAIDLHFLAMQLDLLD
ncbi:MULTISPECIES: hypothetical protein [unclassified Acinetobacter]|uniref:hypothetical protein n=1 Tax=unclassified Acinetobacter TaxID=196816 RepID=UPI0025774B1C|nr:MULTISPECIES: hypothetical protein [unclassified Acinetobacter]MDM1764565.1 hypothetical protein [Acinetobacter sp. 226-1]MDM1767540.1 hypothetical protein [Acinetobacter sp. 226-4]